MLENASQFRAEQVVQINAESFIQNESRRYQGEGHRGELRLEWKLILPLLAKARVLALSRSMP